MVKTQTKAELIPGLFFAPGAYMGWWDQFIATNYSDRDIESHTEFQKYNEMWTGAVIAAAQTLATNDKHYVGLPDDEPSDVDVVKLVETTRPGTNTKGQKIVRLNVQITRCNLAAGETLVGQALHKNKPAYSGIIVAIGVTNRNGETDFEEAHAALSSAGTIYPSQIIAVEQVGITDNPKVPSGSFVLSEIFPGKGHTVIEKDDYSAFFRGDKEYPDVFKKARLATGFEWEDLGNLTLLPPTIKGNK